MAITDQQRQEAPQRGGRARDAATGPRKALTVGAVCKIREDEFDDISV